MPDQPTSEREAEAEALKSAEGIIAAILAKGHQLYGLTLSLEAFRDIVWETRSDRYIQDVRSSIKNLSTKILDAMDTVLEKMQAHAAHDKQVKKENNYLKRKSKMN